MAHRRGTRLQNHSSRKAALLTEQSALLVIRCSACGSIKLNQKKGATGVRKCLEAIKSIASMPAKHAGEQFIEHVAHLMKPATLTFRVRPNFRQRGPETQSAITTRQHRRLHA